jgi:protein required for attachment to host cells
MENIRFVLAGIGMALLLVAGQAIADTATIQALVRITMDLDQHPTEEEKGILKAIIDSDDSSEEDDDLSDASARRLAEILLRINRSPGDDDKVALAALAEE